MVKYNEQWYKRIKKAPLSPPNWVFGTVWPLLYVMMGISSYLISTDPMCKPYCKELNPFFVQLALNLCWTTVFFKYKQIFWGFIMILAILYYSYLTYIQFKTINQFASMLLIPYMIWLSFAAYLNGYIMIFN
jgi:translocator protein